MRATELATNIWLCMCVYVYIESSPSELYSRSWAINRAASDIPRGPARDDDVTRQMSGPLIPPYSTTVIISFSLTASCLLAPSSFHLL